jgi:hypothetical protein
VRLGRGFHWLPSADLANLHHPPLLHTYLSPPFEGAMPRITQHSITFSISELGASSLIQHLADYRVGMSSAESYIRTDGQSASLSWNKAPVWGLRSDFYYCQTVAGLLMWGVLSDERTGLSFTIAPGSWQCRHFRVRVPWDSWP